MGRWHKDAIRSVKKNPHILRLAVIGLPFALVAAGTQGRAADPAKRMATIEQVGDAVADCLGAVSEGPVDIARLASAGWVQGSTTGDASMQFVGYERTSSNADIFIVRVAGRADVRQCNVVGHFDDAARFAELNRYTTLKFGEPVVSTDIKDLRQGDPHITVWAAASAQVKAQYDLGKLAVVLSVSHRP
jgi:hypothetical protein